MREIGFGKKKYPLFWDIYAHDNILKACTDAGYSTLGDWMNEKKYESHGIILYELMCGGIRKHNFEVSMGFKGGEKIPMPDIASKQRKDILSLAHVSDLSEIEHVINLCWVEASKAEVPEELQKYMPDDDYMEIAAEIEKNKPDSEKN